MSGFLLRRSSYDDRRIAGPLLSSRPVRTLATLLFLVVVAAPARADETVRIALGRFRDVFVVEGVEAATWGDGTEAPVPLGGKLKIAPGRVGLRIDGKEVPHDVVRLQAKGTLKVSGHSYRRLMEVSLRTYKGKAEVLVVHPLPLEEYVAGIVSAELPASWPLEAMKAQAIAARTYAVWQKYRRLDLPYHMESTVLDQVYGGAQRETDLARRAVKETHGVVLSWDRRLARTYFFASCGDVTESAAEGWGTPLAYLPGGKCGFCKNAARHTWRADVPAKDLDRALRGVLGERVVDLRIVSTTRTGRVKDIDVVGPTKTKRITGGDLRRLLGYTTLWSTWITRLDVTGKGAHVEGRGAGHGVGLCQWGARGMAEAGRSSDDILARYYPGAALRRLY